jgi:hypothetical protein
MFSGTVKKLLFAREFLMLDGSIRVLGQKMVLFTAESLLDLENIDPEKVYRIFKARTKQEFSKLRERINMQGSDAKNLMEELFEVYGLGSMQIANMDKNKCLVYIRHSSLARAWREKNRKSKKPVCHVVRGVLAGMFSYYFNNDVDCEEQECLAQGYDFCTFLVKKNSKKGAR